MVDKEPADKNPAEKKPPVIETAVITWKDAFRAIEAMPRVAGIAFVLYLAVSLAVFAITNPFALVLSPWLPLFSIGGSIVQAVLFAPLAIVVHRFVLLGETTNRYPLEPKSSRYLHFVGFAILVKVLWVIPNTIQNFPGTQDNPDLKSGLGIVAVVLTITVIIVVVRRPILFPAIAIDAPGATWSKARLDTKGSSWRVAFIFVLTALPPLVINLLLYWLWRQLTAPTQPSTVSFLLFSVLETVVAVPTLCAFAAAASHIYRARADAMTRPQ
jgi:hypothetical protein